MELTRSYRNLLRVELIVPMVLLIIGTYGGLMQVLFRAGVLHYDPLLRLLIDTVGTLLGVEALKNIDWQSSIMYYWGLTLHGVINAIVLTTFFAVAFGNAVVPYFLKQPLNTRIGWLSAIVMLIGVGLAAYAMFTGQASVLYTFYPPLKAHPTFYLGAALLIVGSWIGGANWIPLYRRWRQEHPGEKIPLAVMGMFATFIIWFIATLSVAVEVLFLLLPWSLGWTESVDVPLARALFWFFGHPLVYFWLLPAYVMYYTMLPKVAGGKLFSDAAGRLVFIMFILFSIPVGAHHQFSDPGIGTQWKLVHTFLTYAVALPSLITAFTIAASLEYAGRQNGGRGLFGWMFRLPYFDRERWLFSYWIAGLIIFIFGGLSGIVNASYNLNLAVHNTSWIPGHFHLTVGSPVLLAILGMSLHMVAQLSGKAVRLKSLVVAFPYLWLVGVLIFSWGMMRGGLLGMPRRTYLGAGSLNPDLQGTPLYRADWAPYAEIAMVGGIIMFVAILLYFIAFFVTLFARREQEATLTFPVAEAYHDEPVWALNRLAPWVAAAVVLIVLSYTPVLYDVMRSSFKPAPAYLPEYNVPEKQLRELRQQQGQLEEPSQ
ncbi:MAG: cbb3-type cytochrome c oxidase subunit I [Candidatus Kapabacteria bacterium]|nr:cbb3-type cytochrome c oxidase subunit I [Candidatus Kapabacteria bacterium]